MHKDNRAQTAIRQELSELHSVRLVPENVYALTKLARDVDSTVAKRHLMPKSARRKYDNHLQDFIRTKQRTYMWFVKTKWRSSLIFKDAFSLAFLLVRQAEE